MNTEEFVQKYVITKTLRVPMRHPSGEIIYSALMDAFESNRTEQQSMEVFLRQMEELGLMLPRQGIVTSEAFGYAKLPSLKFLMILPLICEKNVFTSQNYCLQVESGEASRCLIPQFVTFDEAGQWRQIQETTFTKASMEHLQLALKCLIKENMGPLSRVAKV